MNEEDREFSMLELMVVVAENLKLLILGPILTGLLAFAVTFALQQSFTSQAILVLPASPQTPAQAAAMMVSPLVLDPVVRSLNLSEGRPIDVARIGLTKHIKATVGKDGLLRLEVTAGTPREAQAIGNAIIDSWLKSTVPGKLDVADLEKRLEFAKASLESVRRFQAQLTSDDGSSLSKPLSRGEAGTSIVAIGELQARYLAEVLSIPRMLQGLSRDVVLQSPTLPTEPVAPKKSLIAALTALGSGVLLVFLGVPPTSLAECGTGTRVGSKAGKVASSHRNQRVVELNRATSLNGAVSVERSHKSTPHASPSTLLGNSVKSLSEAKLAVIGLGYVGLPLAVEFGKQRWALGFDINTTRISELQSGHDNTLEVESEELRGAKHLYFTSDQAELGGCSVFIVTVPTPIDKANRPDLTPLIKASEMVGKALKPGAVVIYESTVYPGCTEEICVPILEKASGLKFNRDFFCGYSPERINPGDKVNTLTKIKKITSGSTPDVAKAVDELYASIISAGTYPATSLRVAEAAKVIENTQRDLNIALVNELSVIFDRLGIDTIEVLEAAGSKWNFLPFRPGMVGGHCIGVDPYYLTHKAEEVGYHPQVILAGRRINDNMARYTARNVIKRMLRNGIDVARSTVGVLGITFKENCPDIRNSKVVDMVREFEAWGMSVILADPWASADEVAQEYGLRLGEVDPEHPVDSLVVAVGHNEYRDLTPVDLRSLCRGPMPVLADVKKFI